VIHLISPSWPNLAHYIYFPALLKKIPMVISHHVEIEKYNNQYYKKNPILRYVAYLYGLFQFRDIPLLFSSKILSPSNATLDFFRKSFVNNPKKLGTFATGIDQDLFTPLLEKDSDLKIRYINFFKDRNSNPQHIVGYIGRIAIEKNLDILLKLAQRNPDIGFVIIGEGPEKKRLEARAQNISNILFIPVQIGKKLAEHYKMLDAFITPSETETYGFTILEALSCGTPTIMPKIAVFEEIHPELRMWQVDIEDPENVLIRYEEVMQKVLEENRYTQFAFTQEYIKKFSWEKSAIDLVLAYEEAKKKKVPRCMGLFVTFFWALFSLPALVIFLKISKIFQPHLFKKTHILQENS
jgi:glycosyltransferase involved in cell wall biosynthesis